MAKGILRLFGALLIVVGAGIAAWGFTLPTRDLGVLLVTVPTGLGVLVLGAPFLGFAQVIELLEEIARNTRSPHQG